MTVGNLVAPLFMKKAVEVSFLEITVSLVFWAFLLGPSGAILAVPLTLCLKKFLEIHSAGPASAPEACPAPAPSPPER